MKIDKIDSPVYVGRLGETGVQTIDFDVSDWLASFPSGLFTVDFKPEYLPEGFTIPPTQHRVVDGILTIDIEKNITHKAGRAVMGVRLLVGNVVEKRSPPIPVVIAESLPPATGEMPEPIQAWIDGANVVVGEATAAINTANDNVIDSAAFVGDDIVFTKANADEVVLADAKPALKGDTGADSVVPGPKGDKGEQGIQGDQGPKGDKGDMGADSTVPGPQGPQGEVGADSTVPGPKGDDGIQGPKGDKGDTGVYVGSVEPTDPEKNIWIDEDAQQEYSTTYEQAVENGYTKSKEQFFADLEGLEGAIDGANNAANLVDSKLEDIGTAISNANASALAAQNNLLWRRLTTNPASFYPVPQSPLYVRASGEPIQSGTGDPSPENIRPILPWKAEGETVKVRRTGKNLYDHPADYDSRVSTRLKTGLGSPFENVNSTGNATRYPIPVVPNTLYRFSNPEGIEVYGYNQDLILVKSYGFYSNITILMDSDTYYIGFFARNNAHLLDKVQIELGSVATPYEPYIEEEITLTAPQDIYGGWLDNEGNGQVLWHRVVLDGTENWSFFNQSTYPSLFNFNFGGAAGHPYATSYTEPRLCSHFIRSTIFSLNCSYITNNYEHFRINYLSVTTIAGLKAWLAEQYSLGTPVTFMYPISPVPLAPIIAPLTALPQADRITPRLNVVATDAPTLQTDYAKSPIQESNEQNAAIVATGV